MADPAVVTDAVGEYFEIYNTTGRTLHIDGLVISDKNDVSFDVVLEPAAPIEVAPQSYFVFGKNADSATNGGIDRKSTRLNSSHVRISYAVFCLKKKKTLKNPC